MLRLRSCLPIYPALAAELQPLRLATSRSTPSTSCASQIYHHQLRDLQPTRPTPITSMVTLDQAPGLEVTVNVDGVPLREYEDPSDDGGRNKALRYVEAQPGKEFSIVIQLAPRFKHMQRHSVTSDVKVDGKVIVRPLFNREHVYDGGVTRTVNGVERMVKNNWEKRHLTFSNLDIGKWQRIWVICLSLC